jgi:hypothetical protein
MPFEPRNLEALKVAHSNVAITASNHMSDFGAAGTARTLKELSERGFTHTGAGDNLSQAQQNAYLELPVGRVAVLAYSEIHPRVGAVSATQTASGVRPLDRQVCLDDIRKAKQQADWVWVILHWGEEFVRFPNPEHREVAWEFADAGASLVAAAHTHVPLGYEKRGEATIFYGLGNFIFPPYCEARGYNYAWHRSARQGVIAKGVFKFGQWHWRPIEIRLSAKGIPRAAAHGNCPDYGELLPPHSSDYARKFDGLRKKERLQFFLERLCYMSMQERAFRLRQLFRTTPT